MTKPRVETVPILRDNYAYLIIDPDGDAAAVIDPGEPGPVLARLKGLGLRPQLVLLTHHHGDHTGGAAAIADAFGCPIAAPAVEAAKIARVDRPLSEGDTLTLGALPIAILATPGHTLGHLSFLAGDALFCADTLFVLGCGRLSEGDAPMLYASLQRLAALPDATRVFCGHDYTANNAKFARRVDPDNAALGQRATELADLRAAGRPTVPSTIGQEKATNPFLRPADPAIRAGLGLPDAADAVVFGTLRKLKDAA